MESVARVLLTLDLTRPENYAHIDKQRNRYQREALGS